MKKSQYSPELIEKVKEFYLSSTFSLDEISQISLEKFGVKISLADLKYYSRKEKWSILKSNSGRRTEDISINEKLIKIADKLYEVMIDEEEPVPATALAQIARTWSDLLIKSKLDKETSVKIPAQSVKDAIAKHEALLKQGNSNE